MTLYEFTPLNEHEALAIQLIEGGVCTEQPALGEFVAGIAVACGIEPSVEDEENVVRSMRLYSDSVYEVNRSRLSVISGEING